MPFAFTCVFNITHWIDDVVLSADLWRMTVHQKNFLIFEHPNNTISFLTGVFSSIFAAWDVLTIIRFKDILVFAVPTSYVFLQMCP